MPRYTHIVAEVIPADMFCVVIEAAFGVPLESVADWAAGVDVPVGDKGGVLVAQSTC